MCNENILACAGGWCEPPVWPVGDSPIYYNGFGSWTGLTNHGAELVSGLVSSL